MDFRWKRSFFIVLNSIQVAANLNNIKTQTTASTIRT